MYKRLVLCVCILAECIKQISKISAVTDVQIKETDKNVLYFSSRTFQQKRLQTYVFMESE
ncbi:hypothetical protein RGT18_10610 [Solobacterium moorei]|nr:hypothetical protein RGT18_10610 [Solobacterium moorei]